MTTALRRPTTAAPATPGRRRAGLRTAYGWELRKLGAQARTRWTLLLCLVAPVLIVFVLDGQQRAPKDNLYGRQIHSSGYAMPLLVLTFATQWLLPLLTSIVAGDIFASEDQHGTWKTILTRSVSRGRVFWAKTLASVSFAIATLVVLASSVIVSSTVIVGTQPLTGLGGQLLPGSTALRLVVASWALALPPLLGFTGLAILLSVTTRNSSVGVVAPLVLGFVMQLVGSLGGVDLLRRVLLATPFEAWHGLLSEPRFAGPLYEGLAVSGGWLIVCLGAAYLVLQRRDITGG